MKMHVSTGFLKKFNGFGLIIWVLLIIPTLTIWRESVPWLNFMSIYAIIIAHMSSWIAARAEKQVEKQ